MNHVSTPAEIHLAPFDGRFAKAAREWQGCPTIAVTGGGRLYAAWYTGGPLEPDLRNHNVIATSDDHGDTWTELAIVKSPDGVLERSIDIQFWQDDDRLCACWTATACTDKPFQPGVSALEDYFDGRFGVWYSFIVNPDSARPTFTRPERLCDGFLRCRPTALSDGSLACCAYDWLSERLAYHVSRDGFKTAERRAAGLKAEGRGPQFDENMLYQKRDGTQLMYSRGKDGVYLCRSADGGRTWTDSTLAFRGPSSRFFISRLSGDETLLIRNDHPAERSRMTAYLSEDDGETWGYKLCVDNRGRVSYPDAVQRNGAIHMVHDFSRGEAGEIPTPPSRQMTCAVAASCRSLSRESPDGLPSSPRRPSTARSKEFSADELMMPTSSGRVLAVDQLAAGIMLNSRGAGV